MVVICGLLGGVIGFFVALYYGTKDIEQPYWGWVPFGIGTTHVQVVDNAVVSLGTLCGCLAGIVLMTCLRTVMQHANDED